MKEAELIEALDLGEDYVVEFKDGRGGFPNSAWESISAFANTAGGHLVLGVEQKHGGRSNVLIGIERPQSYLKLFWDTLHNKSKFSHPVCGNEDVVVKNMGGKSIISIYVPPVPRGLRPVFVGQNPLTGTFKRRHEGDYPCSAQEIYQMLRDASDDHQDLTIYKRYGIDDLEEDALTAFRRRFSSRAPDHPYLAHDNRGLLECLGGWRRDRQSGDEGLTLAGLVMFGKERTIKDNLPGHLLDYQDQCSDDPELRWIDRITSDGKWHPNVFNFYFRVYPRLVDGLRIPFDLDEEAVRIEQSTVHHALREAIVNTLVHADHRSNRPIRIIKRKDAFLFENPGRLRVPVYRLFREHGGQNLSDPRNPNLQMMFSMLGLGERAGTGYAKIFRAWREKQRLTPLIRDDSELNSTTVTLPLVSLVPEEVERELRKIVGHQYPLLTELDRVILVSAHQFGEISNPTVQLYRSEHPIEIGERLKFMADRAWLVREGGHGRGRTYRLAGTKRNDLFSRLDRVREEDSLPKDVSSIPNDADTLPMDELMTIAAEVRKSKRAPKLLMQTTILSLCRCRFLTVSAMTTLVGRKSDEKFRQDHISPMVAAGQLRLKYPDLPRHPGQAYRTVDDAIDATSGDVRTSLPFKARKEQNQVR